MEEKKQHMKMYDIDKVYRFETFLYENYDKCIMPKINYSINERTIINWKACLKSRYIDNLEETKRISRTSAFLLSNNKQIDTITEQDGKNVLEFANIVDSSMTRITFDELLKQTKKISDELIHQLLNEYKNHVIVIVIDNHLYSSNTWYTMLVMKPLFEHPKIRQRIVNVIDKVSQFQNGIDLPDVKPEEHDIFHSSVKNKFLKFQETFFIHADDMSYSGHQLFGHIPLGLKYLLRDTSNTFLFKQLVQQQFVANPFVNDMIGYTSNRYYIAIPYIGSQAIPTYFPELKMKIGGFLERDFYTQSIFILPKNIVSLPSLSHAIWEQTNSIHRFTSINETLSKPYFQKLFRYNNGSLPIFFDHKLADAISTLTYIISFSTCSPIKNKELIMGHMVKNCESPPISEIVDGDENKLRGTEIYDFTNESSRCPKSFYKTLIYTYKGIEISKEEFSNKSVDYFLGLALHLKPFS